MMKTDSDQKIQIPIAVILLLVQAVLKPMVSYISYIYTMHGHAGIFNLIVNLLRLPFDEYYRSTMAVMLINLFLILVICVLLIIRYNDLYLAGSVVVYSVWSIIQILWHYLKYIFIYRSRVEIVGVLSDLFEIAAYVMLALTAVFLLIELSGEIADILKKVWFLPGVFYAVGMVLNIISIRSFWWIRANFIVLLLDFIFIAGLLTLGWWFAEPDRKEINIQINRESFAGTNNNFGEPDPENVGHEQPKDQEKEEEVSPGFCSNCGRKLQAGMKFCPSCGKKIE